MAEIPFDAGEKLRWLETIASNPRAHGLDVRISIGITSRIGKHQGRAPIAQSWLAKFTGASERGVREAADHLVELGHLKIDRSEAVTASNRKAFGGRGKANIYDPVLPPKPVKETRNWGSGFAGGETQQSPARNPAISRTKPGTPVPPLPKELQKTSFRAAENETDPLDPLQLRWQAVKGRLAKRVTAADMRSWFDHLTVKRMDEHEAVLVARDPFVCKWIEDNYLGDRLLEAWKAEQTTIVRVLLITRDDAAPMQRAAE